ncbi:MAG: response regulator transcription factor [Clostridia bacterium]|nr:response regulator transcription factor [Clostridia bacterium]
MERELVLVADGDRRIRNLIHITLQAHDYKCITASGGESAILMASSNQPKAVLLELNLPDMDGTEVIRKIRSWSDVPIVVISSRLEDHDKVMALDAGADDYMTKPFSVEELLARLRVMERRYRSKNHPADANPVFQNGGLKVDFASNCVFVQGEEVHLTPIEYKILCLLSQNCGKVLTHTDITREIWGNSWESTITTLRTFMASLRKKIGTHQNGEYIHTHTGVGYRMVAIEN